MRTLLKESAYRRQVFYQLHGHLPQPDAHQNFPIQQRPDTIVDDALRYLMDGSSFLCFPGAARAVAIAVADLLSRAFGEDFLDNLSDPDLMHGNDPYFLPYPDDRDTYDAILAQLSRDDINWTSERMQITRQLIEAEYLLDTEGQKSLPRSTWK